MKCAAADMILFTYFCNFLSTLYFIDCLISFLFGMMPRHIMPPLILVGAIIYENREEGKGQFSFVADGKRVPCIMSEKGI